MPSLIARRVAASASRKIPTGRVNDNLTPDSEPWSTGAREVLQLFPPPTRARRLEGLYLNERMPPPARGAPALVYANFVSSLDGRIAVTDDDGVSRLPEGLTNPRDWRLFRELQAHADCLVTHGGYLRALATGRLGNVLQVGLGADGGDIARWRAAREMTAQPAIAIVSASLELPMPTSLAAHGQRVHVLTTEASRRDRRVALRQAGLDVVVTGPGPWVRSREAIDALAECGYRRLYLQTGPKMLEVALREGTLARLYLTIRHRIAGGERFDTMVGGGVLGESGRVRLGALYLDEACGQFFACFDATGGSGTEGW